MQDFQPVFRLITFLERNLVFGDKIPAAGSINSLMDISADAGGRAEELILQYAMPFYIVSQAYNGNREIQTLFGKGMSGHGDVMLDYVSRVCKIFPDERLKNKV